MILILSMIFFSLSVSTGINLTIFRDEALVQHNYRRQQHCVPLIALNATLNTIAQNYSAFLADNNLFNHSYYSGVGENLWAIGSTGTLSVINGQIR